MYTVEIGYRTLGRMHVGGVAHGCGKGRGQDYMYTVGIGYRTIGGIHVGGVAHGCGKGRGQDYTVEISLATIHVPQY
jgi:hypothetical protein